MVGQAEAYNCTVDVAFQTELDPRTATNLRDAIIGRTRCPADALDDRQPFHRELVCVHVVADIKRINFLSCRHKGGSLLLSCGYAPTEPCLGQPAKLWYLENASN